MRHRPALRIAFALVALAAAARQARADGPAPDAGIWRVRSGGPLAIDGGLVLGQPAALGTGLSTGVGAGASYGRLLAVGLRASWSTATESSMAWQVTQADYKLRATAAVQRAVGRGRLALRLGAGPTFVHETRLRNQSTLQTSATSTLAAGELEGVVAVHIVGPWLLTMSGGPSLTIIDGGAHVGWTSLIGAGWQP